MRSRNNLSGGGKVPSQKQLTRPSFVLKQRKRASHGLARKKKKEEDDDEEGIIDPGSSRAKMKDEKGRPVNI